MILTSGLCSIHVGFFQRSDRWIGECGFMVPCDALLSHIERISSLLEITLYNGVFKTHIMSARSRLDFCVNRFHFFSQYRKTCLWHIASDVLWECWRSNPKGWGDCGMFCMRCWHALRHWKTRSPSLFKRSFIQSSLILTKQNTLF